MKYEVFLGSGTSTSFEAENYEINYETGKIWFYQSYYSRLAQMTKYATVALFNFNNIKGFANVKESKGNE